MADEEEGKPATHHKITFTANLGFRGQLERSQIRRWTDYQWSLNLITLLWLVFLPPLVTWALTPNVPALAGFPGVVVGWAVGGLGWYVGKKSVVEHEKETHYVE